MTRDDAQRRCDQLNREHPDRGTHRWVPQENGQGWLVVRVSLPHAVALSPLRAPRQPLTPDARGV
jgi:hypothetical protein